MSRKALCAFTLASALAIPALSVYGKKNKTETPEPPAIPQMTADQKILHALNRLAYGPRPGDVEAIKKAGLDRWIDWQLHPEAIGENPKLIAKLQILDTLQLPPDVMIESYPPPQLIRAMVQGRAPLPEDPLVRLMIRPQMERFEFIQNKGKKAATPEDQAATRRAADMEKQPDLDAVISTLPGDQKNIIKNGTQLEKVALLEKLEPAMQIEILEAWKQPQRQGLFPLASPVLRRRISIINGAQQIIYSDLA